MAKKRRENGGHLWDTERKENLGRPKKWIVDDLVASLGQLEPAQRSSLRIIATNLGIPKSTLADLKADGIIRKIKRKMKPVLTEASKVERVMFCENKCKADGLYEEMFDRVHVDEKWFYISQVVASHWAATSEAKEARRGKATNTRKMPKLMFIAAVARPQWDHSRNQAFDGKVGIWPLAKQVAAKRSSTNRPRGTMEWKQIEKVNTSVINDYLFEKVIPAILLKWPRIRNKILIQ